MANTDLPIPILGTKLYRPPVTADYTSREAVQTGLERGFDLPLALVCAPAGYGKSTSVSHWLENSSLPFAWISLDDTDSDFRNFLSYLIAALRNLETDSCRRTLQALNDERLPDLPTIAGYLIADVEDLARRTVLVLDDFHRISDSDVLKLLEALLAHPLHKLHLVIVSRRDPLLPLALLRVRHLVNEIRMRDLRFSDEETRSFLRTATGQETAIGVIRKLQDKTEGWPAGLRLAILALGDSKDVNGLLSRFGANTRPLQEYLATEVLASLSPQMQAQLVHTVILGRFSASLCESVWGDEFSAQPDALDGKAFIEKLVGAEIFCISLDASDEWYRFHHLFQDLLVQQSQSNLDKEEIARLHHRASSWFLDHEYYEEAASHALAEGDRRSATAIIGQARHHLMDSDQWRRLESWLKLFPDSVIDQQPQLLLSRCWLDLYLHYRLDLFAEDAELADTLLNHCAPEFPGLDELSAELNSLQSVVAYSNSEGTRSLELAQQALNNAPRAQECVRSTAYWIYAMAFQMCGKSVHRAGIVWQAIGSGDLRTPAGEARPWIGEAQAAWCDADSRRLRRATEQLQKLGMQHDLNWSRGFAQVFLGVLHYEQNELDEAIAALEVIASQPEKYVSARIIDSYILLSLCHQEQGNDKLARRFIERISDHVVEHSALFFEGLGHALQAEIDARQGRLAQATQWANAYTLLPDHSMQRFYQSEYAAVRVLLAQDSDESRTRAAEILEWLDQLANKIHHRRLHIQVLCLRAALARQGGDEASTLELLGQAFEMGKPSRLIRPMIDGGREMIQMLNRLDLDAEGMEYLGALLAALPQSADELSSATTAAPDVLSQRELEILELLARDHSNKLIAEKLFISPGTVKRHAHNIFSKLGVKGRQSAVSKAIGLGILNK